MFILKLGIDFALYAALFVVPGAMLARLSRGAGRAATAHERLALATGVTAFGVPPLLFLVTALTFKPLTWLPAALVAGLIAVAYLVRRRGLARAADEAPLASWRELRRHPAPLGAAAFAFAYQFLFFDTVTDFHLTCTYFPCVLPTGQAISGAIEGMPAFGQIEGVNTSLYFAGHQRMGVTAVLSPAMVLLGLPGLRMQWGLVLAALPLAVYALSLRLGAGTRSAAFASAVAALLPCIVLQPDQNRLVLSLTGLIALALCTRAVHAAGVGALLALLYGAEPVSLLGFGALVPFVAASHPRAELLRPVAGMTLGFALGVLPFLLRYALAFGHPFFHEHFSYIPPIRYELLGIPFHLPAFLNWPLRDELVRSAYNPFPNLVLLPLAVEKHLGVVFLAPAVLGFASLAVRRPWAALSMALFSLPIAGFLAVNENWTQVDKWSIVVMAYLPAFLLLAIGLTWLFRRRLFLARLAALAAVVGAVVALHGRLVRVQAPEDPLYRALWGARVQFMPAEDPFYVAAQRERLREVSVLPGAFEAMMPSPDNVAALRSQVMEPSLFQRTPTLTDRFMAVLSDPSWPVLLPEGVSAEGLRAPYVDAPLAGALDLSRAPSDGVEPRTGARSEPRSCTPDQPRITLRPFAQPVAVRVPWNEEPVLVSLLVADSTRFGLLLVARTVLHRDRTRFFSGEIPDRPCALVFLPAGYRLNLMDMVSMNPNRAFFWEVTFGAEAPWPATLTFGGP